MYDDQATQDRGAGTVPGSGEDKGPAEDKLCMDLWRWFDAAEAYWRPRFREIREARQYARGVCDGDGEVDDREVRINVAHSTIVGLMPHIYARNPEIGVSVTEAVASFELQAFKGFARTLSVILNTQFKKSSRLKRAMKRATRGALTSALYWLKVTYQRDYRRDPVIQQRIEDAQDNLARLERQMQRVHDEQLSGDQVAAERQRLADLVAALNENVEVMVSEGLTVDVVQPEHLIIDPAIPSIEDYEQSRRIAQKIYMPLSKARQLTGDQLTGAKTYGWAVLEEYGRDEARRQDEGTGTSVDPLVCMVELWDHDTLTVYTMVVGIKRFVREPESPTALGQQWHGFFPLLFHPTDGYQWPLSLILDLLKPPADEYNSLRTQQKEHREISIPHWVADAETDQTSLRRHRDATLGEIVLVDARGRPLNQVIERAEPPAYNPALYDVQPPLHDIDMMTGLQDAQRGGIVKAKTATEAEILQRGLNSRASEMQETIEDLLSAMAVYAAQVLLQELSVQQAQRLAGPDAVWPVLDKQRAFELVEVSIRAGSAGKPNRAQERADWAEVAPVIAQLQDSILQLIAMAADPSHKISMLRETLRRFDESLDLDEYLPADARPFLQGQPAPALAMAVQGDQAGAMPPGAMPPGAPPGVMGGGQAPVAAPPGQLLQ